MLQRGQIGMVPWMTRISDSISTNIIHLTFITIHGILDIMLVITPTKVTDCNIVAVGEELRMEGGDDQV